MLPVTGLVSYSFFQTKVLLPNKIVAHFVRPKRANRLNLTVRDSYSHSKNITSIFDASS